MRNMARRGWNLTLAALFDRSKAPRRWWYPIYPELGPSYGHEETSKTLRRTLFALIVFSFFCAFTLLGTPDKELIAGGSKIRVPIPLVADYGMSFIGFLVVGPIVSSGNHGLFAHLHPALARPGRSSCCW